MCDKKIFHISYNILYKKFKTMKTRLRSQLWQHFAQWNDISILRIRDNLTNKRDKQIVHLPTPFISLSLFEDNYIYLLGLEKDVRLTLNFNNRGPSLPFYIYEYREVR